MANFFAGHIERIRLSELREARSNARTHSVRQIRQIADAIRRFGFTNPVLMDDANVILAGHGRVAAAKLLGMTEVPCIWIGAMSQDEKRAYAIADNAIALKSGWDAGILAIELQELMDVGFEVELTGFDLTEIDQIIENANEASVSMIGPEDDYSEPEPSACPVAQAGDVWLLGRHRLVCGDAKDEEALDALLGDERADMVFTDPPYNVPIDGNVCGSGRVKHREFAEAAGEMSRPAFIGFLTSAIRLAAESCRDGAILYACMDWRHITEIIAAGEEARLELKNVCVWTKTNGGMGTFYRSQHELVTVWKVGDAPHTNNFGLGDKGRYRTNVWSYPGVNVFKAARMEELKLHPTVKPVALVADAIRDVSHRNQIVLDPFGGSGTTLIAAEKTGRRARLIELDPLYCDAIIGRWEKLTGKFATLSPSGADFETVRAQRTNLGGWGTIAPVPDQQQFVERDQLQ